MKVALAYDKVNKWGGAERVLLALHKVFPKAPLYTSVYNKKSAPWASVFSVKTSFLQKIPFAKSRHDLLAPLMPLAFESFDFSEYDLVISVTSESAKGIITNSKTKHICYCLTPTRYLWSGYSEYFKNPIKRIMATPFVNYLKKWDIASSKRPDVFIGISKEVKARIKKYYKRDSIIIYPPVEIADFSKSHKSLQGDYFLVVSRLVPYKRIDLAISACNRLNLPLKIIGIGSDAKKLKRLAGKSIEFLGKVTDEELINYYKNSKALIFPGKEDFGLTMVEAQAFGKPVIAFKEGGALDIVRSGVTGKFFNKQSPESLMKALENFNPSRYNSKLCREGAKRFSFSIFQDKLIKAIDLKI